MSRAQTYETQVRDDGEWIAQVGDHRSLAAADKSARQQCSWRRVAMRVVSVATRSRRARVMAQYDFNWNTLTVKKER